MVELLAQLHFDVGSSSFFFLGQPCRLQDNYATYWATAKKMMLHASCQMPIMKCGACIVWCLIYRSRKTIPKGLESEFILTSSCSSNLLISALASFSCSNSSCEEKQTNKQKCFVEYFKVNKLSKLLFTSQIYSDSIVGVTDESQGQTGWKWGLVKRNGHKNWFNLVSKQIENIFIFFLIDCQNCDSVASRGINKVGPWWLLGVVVNGKVEESSKGVEHSGECRR